MAAAPTTSAPTAATRERTPAQWFALVGGATLVLVGLLGFVFDASFEFGEPHSSGKLLGIFEVNGVHNLVHIATGALLLAGARGPTSAKAVTLLFGVAYALVTLIGLAQGNTVLGIIPVNGADNVLHIALTASALGAGLASRGAYRRSHR